MKELSHWIDGKEVKGTSGRFSDVYNPATGEVIARVPLATPAELDAAIASAAEAQIAWAATNPQRRARVMMKFGQLINDNKEMLAELVSLEHGKTLPDARGDVHTDTGGYARSLRVFDDQRGVGAETTDFAGHIIEWGSSRQSPQAPLRHAADAAGRFEER